MRSVGAIVVLILGVLCLVLAPAVVWGRNLLLDTDRYVQTLEPLAADPGIQAAVISTVDTQFTSNVDISALLDPVLPSRAAQLLKGPLQSAANTLVHTVATKFVQSDAFHTDWVGINRIAHQQVGYLLTGEAPKNTAVRVADNGDVNLDLSQVVDQVKARLVDAGLSAADKVPSAGATIVIGNVAGLQRAQTLTRWLDHAADWLPWVGLVLLIGGILLARRRRRALVISVLCVAGGLVLIGIGLLIGRGIFVDQVTSNAVTSDTAGRVFDTLVRYLRWSIRLLILLALLVAFGAWIGGSGRLATRLRRGVVRGPHVLGSYLNAGPVGPFVEQYATPLRIFVVGIMALILLLQDAPSLGTVILLAVICVVLLLLIEVLRAAAHRRRDTVPT